MRRAVVFVQLLALSSACRSDPSQSNTNASGGERRIAVDPSPSHVVTVAECSEQMPSDRLCAAERERCAGSSVSCAQPARPGEFAPCGGAQWQCQCVAQQQQEGLRWECRQQMHAAGPLPPPELWV